MVVRSLLGIAMGMTVLLIAFLWHTNPQRRLRVARRRSKRRFVADQGGGVGGEDDAEGAQGGGVGGEDDAEGAQAAHPVLSGDTESAGHAARFNGMAAGRPFDPDAMVMRFRERAAGVKRRNLPPVAGEERKRFLEQAQTDFQDFSIIGDAETSLEDGILKLTVDLRPADARD